jgi:DAACS family dicarboxylate/amino acid:cation (Na+ or H+) symporter
VSSFINQKLLPLYMVIGLVAGASCGIFLPHIGTLLLPIGTAFIQAIKMLIVPLVVCSITLAIYHVSTRVKNRSLIMFSFVYFLFATVLAACIGVGINLLLQPGQGFIIPQGVTAPEIFVQQLDWTKYFLDLIPSNIFVAMSGGNLLPVIFFSSLFAMALASIGEQAKPVINLLESLLAAIFKITAWIIAFSPIAVFAIISWLVATQGLSTLFALSRLLGTTYLAFVIILLLFFIILKAIGDRPVAVLKGVWQPVFLAFTTRSSDVTLPLHIEKLVALGVPQHIASALLLLGYAFNRSGATLYTALAVVFLADAYGLTLDWESLLSIVVLSVIAINGCASVPSGALVAIAVVATGIGLPVEAIAIIAGIDVLVDMGRTAVNVFGNTVAIKVVTKITGTNNSEALLSENASTLPHS